MKQFDEYKKRDIAFILFIALCIVLALSMIRCTKYEEVILPYYDTTFVIINDSNKVIISDTIRIFINDTNYIYIYIYDTIKTTTIGSQQWMDKDLSVISYNDGNLIKIAYDNADWALNEPSCCYYLNNDNNGLLYNWYTVNTGKLCPDGFHVPSDYDWNVLMEYIGGTFNGCKLKESGYDHWKQPNYGATNEYGFNAIPTWGRYYNGEFFKDDIFTPQPAVYWSSSIDNETGLAIYYTLNYINYQLVKYRHSLNMGYAVRCIKDN